MMAAHVQCCFQRYEKKYMLNPGQLTKLLEGMRPYVRPDEFGQYTICNIYYDTDDFQLIRTSLEKPVYKEKLRMRSYGVPSDQDKVFVELKKKYDGIVYKRRTVMKAADAAAYVNDGLAPKQKNQICHEIDWFMQSYHPIPKVFIAYDRMAFAGLEHPDLRITFDTKLRWRDQELDLRAGDHGSLILPSDQILMELKLPGTSPVWLAHLLSQTGVFPVSFSKYGTCYQQNILGRISPEKRKEEARVCA